MPPRPQPSVTRGSQRWMQHLVNERPGLLHATLAPRLGLSDGETISWRSPLQADGYAEYYDAAFLDALGIALPQRPLESFWPASGPRWDALGVTSRGNVLLVEAKSHITELISSSAATPASLKRIHAAFAEVQAALHVRPAINWSTGLYQAANRLSHLYLLRALNGHPAWLISLCFANDSSIDDPATAEAWHGALTLQRRLLGLGRHTLSRYVCEIVLDVGPLQEAVDGQNL